MVGRFMVAFGSIESSINELLRNTQSDGAMELVMTLRLEQRIDLLRKTLPDWKDLSDKNKSILLVVLDEVQHLAKTRNLIAHNPLTVQMLYLPDPKDKPLVEKAKRAQEYIKHEITQKFITLPELTAQAKRVWKVAVFLQMAWIDYDMAYMGGKPLVLKKP